jgi:hypothetical protein
MSRIFQHGASVFFHQRDDDNTNDLSTTVAADALVIPVSHGYVAKTTGADAEALTLANGSPGQVLVVNIATAGGGDGTLTPATSTGFATIVLAVAGDQAVLMYVNDSIGWILISVSGTAVALSPLYTV